MKEQKVSEQMGDILILDYKAINEYKKPHIVKKSLNLHIRRADWRFLLFNPSPEKSMCFTEGELASAVKLISGSVIDSDSNVDDCDLAVAVNPDQATLQTACSALRPGGSCYIEWNVNPLFNPKSIRTKLETEGFDHIALYLPKPSPIKSHPVIWIPIEDTRALAFFMVESLKNRPKNIFKYLCILVRSYIWRINSKLFTTLPWLLDPSLKNYTVCSIARKKSTAYKSKALNKNALQSSGSSKLKHRDYNIIETLLNSTGLEESLNNVSISMLTGGRSIINKAILLVFTQIHNEPSFIIKMPRTAKSASQLASEAQTLRTLQEKYENLNGIPKLLFYDHSPGFSIVAETFISGTPIERILTKKNFKELAAKGTDFLLKLALKTKINASEDSWDKLVKPIHSNFISHLGPVLSPELIQVTNDIIKELELTQLVCEHTDFSPWNVLIRPDGEIGVLDWENSRVHGLPLLDLIYFLSYLSVNLDRAFEPDSFVKSYRAMLDETTFTGRVYKECMTKYCAEIEIPPSLISSLRLLTWLNVINWRYYELSQHDGNAPSIETIRDIIELSLWEIELEMCNRCNEPTNQIILYKQIR